MEIVASVNAVSWDRPKRMASWKSTTEDREGGGGREGGKERGRERGIERGSESEMKKRTKGGRGWRDGMRKEPLTIPSREGVVSSASIYTLGSVHHTLGVDQDVESEHYSFG